MNAEKLQPNNFSDMEKRLFLAAMSRELKICERVDNQFPDPEVSLSDACRRIENKVKRMLF